MNDALLNGQLAQGWNTWNTASVLSHVLLPYGFAVNLGLKDYATQKVLHNALIGRFGEDEEKIHPGIRSYDGSYTELTMTFQDIVLEVKTAVRDNQLYLLVTPVQTGIKPPALLVSVGMLWNKAGYVRRDGDVLRGFFDRTGVAVYVSGKRTGERNCFFTTPYLSVALDEEIVISTGAPCTVEAIKGYLKEAREAVTAQAGRYGALSEAYEGMRSCLAWDTIYEPENGRVCSPVSRIWNVGWGGYVLFCWDTFFAAAMIGLEHKELAYANVFAVLNEITEKGFVPNFGAAEDNKSRDRSQPPVGSMVVRKLYQQYGERWFLEEVFDRLMRWNTWFYENRMEQDGTLCWGSDAFEPRLGARWESDGVHGRFGAALESGLDNSPMYDDVPFCADTSRLCLSDVGLTGLYIMDCSCLGELAEILGRVDDRKTLAFRQKQAEAGLNRLWDDTYGIYCNLRTDTGEFSHRFSPTNFYALFSSRVTKVQKDRMLKEHFYNPEEFWGDYIMPSIARNDPAYPDQDYWRGRIWAPMNYLAYAALKRGGLEQACRDLAEKSEKLFLQEWRLHGHVHENYCGDTGMGCGVSNSDKFYHWGGLLAYIAILEAGLG